MLFPWMTATYFIVTRLVLAVLSIGTIGGLIYKGKFHKIDSEGKFMAFFLPLSMMIPFIGECVAVLMAIFGIIGLLCYGASKADDLSKARELAIRADSVRDEPSSGQVSLTTSQDGQLTLVDKLENNEMELKKVRDRLNNHPTPSDIVSGLLNF